MGYITGREQMQVLGIKETKKKVNENAVLHECWWEQCWREGQYLCPKERPNKENKTETELNQRTNL